MSDISWNISETSFYPETNRAYEGLFTLGSGYLHIRGCLEEHLNNCPQNNVSPRELNWNLSGENRKEGLAKWGTYVPGVFAEHPIFKNELVNLPWFLGLIPIVNGEKLDMELSKVENYQRVLNLRNATLKRSLKWLTKSGANIEVGFERFVSAARPNICIQKIEVTSDRDVRIKIIAGIDANVLTNGYDHFKSVDVSGCQSDTISCRVITNGDDIIEMQSQCCSNIEAQWKYESGNRVGSVISEFKLKAGHKIYVEKRNAVTTSRDIKTDDPERMLSEINGLSYENLHEEHCEMWQKRWDRSDVLIEGDEVSQLALRTSIFHLIRCHVIDDSRVAIDPKGYAGDAYWGRFFWDTEIYMLPFYIYTNSAWAKTLLEFRINTLEGAKANAARYGYNGAKYPWESDHLGREGCPQWQYSDCQVHVNADIVYAMCHYAQATDSNEFLKGPASKVITETARYWLQRIDRRPGENNFSLLGVMGPDEYKPLSNNNSYTNRMAAFTLERAAKYAQFGGATAHEIKQFDYVSNKLPISENTDGLVLQCEEFERYAEPRFDELWLDRSKHFAKFASQERIYRSKCLKQADVLLLMMLFSQEFSEKQIRNAWDYYLPLTTHDSSLSIGIHTIMALHLGLYEEAWILWQRCVGIDMDVTNGGAADGIHIALAGMCWQTAVFGFAGLSTAMQSDTLKLAPKLPDKWRRVKFQIHWKGRIVIIDISTNEIKLYNKSEKDLDIEVCGIQHTLKHNKNLQLPLNTTIANK